MSNTPVNKLMNRCLHHVHQFIVAVQHAIMGSTRVALRHPQQQKLADTMDTNSQ